MKISFFYSRLHLSGKNLSRRAENFYHPCMRWVLASQRGSSEKPKFMQELSYGNSHQKFRIFTLAPPEIPEPWYQTQILHFINRNKLHVNPKNVVSSVISRPSARGRSSSKAILNNRKQAPSLIPDSFLVLRNFHGSKNWERKTPVIRKFYLMFSHPFFSVECPDEQSRAATSTWFTY